MDFFKHWCTDERAYRVANGKDAVEATQPLTPSIADGLAPAPLDTVESGRRTWQSQGALPRCCVPDIFVLRLVRCALAGITVRLSDAYAPLLDVVLAYFKHECENAFPEDEKMAERLELGCALRRFDTDMFLQEMEEYRAGNRAAAPQECSVM